MSSYLEKKSKKRCPCKPDPQQIHVATEHKWGHIIGDIHNQQDLIELLSSMVTPAAGEKEVVRVLTYSASAPESPSDGDYYINSSSNQLFYYDEDEWVEAEPNTEEIFITKDTNHMYVYDNEEAEFDDVTGEMIDNTIYTNDLVNDLEVTDNGMYTVCYTTMYSVYWYTLSVVKSYGPRRPGRPQTIYYNQILQNNEGYMTRRKTNDGDWSEWVESKYVFEPELEEVRDIAELGLVM